MKTKNLILVGLVAMVLFGCVGIDVVGTNRVGGFFIGVQHTNIKVLNGLANRASILTGDKEFTLEPGGQMIFRAPLLIDARQVILTARVIDSGGKFLGTATMQFSIPASNSGGAWGEQLWHITSFQRAM